jgi:membrane protein implicated in regulation of membrane protease activity
MNWWGWVIAGAVLFGAELGFVNAQFYLVFVGASAIVVGLLAGVFPTLNTAAQCAIFAVVAIVSMVLFRSRIYRRWHGELPRVDTGPAGGIVTVPIALAPGESCQAEHAGSFWTVRNDGATAIASGARVRITNVQGLTLLVRADA